jgi:transcriptional regulator with XRE-family HTH domain
MQKNVDRRAPATGPKANAPRRSREAVARQGAKIREIGDALRAAGDLSLTEQARALGLSRSTAWAILQARHKSSGLSAVIINRMLAAQGLPPAVRTKIFEYVAEKRAGFYGHSKRQTHKFMINLSVGLSSRRTGRRQAKRHICD